MRASTILPPSSSAARVSPMPRSTSHSGNAVPGGFQKHARFGQRKPDHVGITAGDVPDIDLAIALERVAAGLAAPFAVACVEVNFLVRKPLHRDHRLDQPL